MSSRQYLRELISDRLTAAAEEIFRAFEKTIDVYEEELERHRSMLEVVCKPEIRLHRIDLPHQPACKEEILQDQESSSSLGSTHIKEDLEEISITPEENTCLLLQEIDTPVSTLDSEGSRFKETEPDDADRVLSHCFPEEFSLAVGKDVEEEIRTERKWSNSNQEEPVKPETEKISISQNLEQFVLKQIPDDKERDHMETEADSGHWKCDIPEAHIRKHTGEKPYNCHTCGRGYNVLSSFVYHKNMHTKEKLQACKTCGKCFPQNSQLKSHIKTWTGEKPYTCEVCGEKFSLNRTLTQHKRKHTGETPHVCDVCGKSFANYSNLRIHMRTHTGEKPFSCETCGKGFTMSQHLKSHIRCHTGEKPFSCETCGKGFTMSQHLKSHMRSHKGEKPYYCEACGKCFGQQTHLKVHMRTHTGEKPFSCETCGKSFSQQQHLKVHRRTHTGERPFPCEKCGKCFTDCSAITRHMRTHK